ncbi:MAG: hypothetical protein ABSC56_08460 [Solirubrobacteraceae bacterium]|jgi:hypothetical protein
MIETRGRTGRKPTSAEKSGSGGRAGAPARARGEIKTKRYERPPTWKSAFVRAVIAAAVVYAISTLVLKRPVLSNLILVPVVLLIYAPLIYYTDFWLYRRYQRKRAAR